MICCGTPMVLGLYKLTGKTAYLCGRCERLIDRDGVVIWPPKREPLDMREAVRKIIQEVARYA